MYIKSQRIIFYMFLLFIVLTIALGNLQSQNLTKILNETRIIMRWNRNDNIFCHYDFNDDSLQSAEDMDFGSDSIFFHETSCRSGLNSRQACVIESAARLHPNRSVYVLFSASVTEAILQRSCLKELQKLNVKFFRVHLPEYAAGTGMENILMNRIEKASRWKIEHTSDILRFITLYKYGGIYLDTDTLVVKQLDSLGKNWAGRETLKSLNVAAMAATKNGIGHEVCEAVLKSIREDYRPDIWNYNGPGALTRTLMNICDKYTKIRFFSAEKCKGFEVYAPRIFYLKPYEEFKTFFKPGNINDYKKSYGIHLWNRFSHKLKIKKNSLIHNLAKKYCPSIVKFFDNNL